MRRWYGDPLTQGHKSESYDKAKIYKDDFCGDSCLINEYINE